MATFLRLEVFLVAPRFAKVGSYRYLHGMWLRVTRNKEKKKERPAYSPANKLSLFFFTSLVYCASPDIIRFLSLRFVEFLTWQTGNAKIAQRGPLETVSLCYE